MASLALSFESGEESLSVRRFTAREGISSLFEVEVVALSPSEDLDLESMVGKAASLRVEGDEDRAYRPSRRWGGLCSFMEQEQAEEKGLSTYRLQIVPVLWLLTQRRNRRVFQRLSAPEIARALLAEWAIEAAWSIDEARHPKLDYRVQHGESDYAFLCRLLEEAGISFMFVDEGDAGSRLHLSDDPHAIEARPGGAVSRVEDPRESRDSEYVTRVRIAHAVRPGKVRIQGYDLRTRSDYKLVGEAAVAGSIEERLEQFHYEHAAFTGEEAHPGEPSSEVEDARAEEKGVRERAERLLGAERISKRRVSYLTNAIDLRPGVVFSIAHPARSDLDENTRLLATGLTIEGSFDGDPVGEGQAVFAASPYYPPRNTPKPHVSSVESAVVVGPKGQEIYTDELGRVRVQFHWDREGRFDERSSCWVPVSQAWAGSGFGALTLPRVGQEVLVGFFEGDPDQPVVVGRVFNSTARVPYNLPEHKTRSTWKSASSPGLSGSNELMFEDERGRELVYLQAERDLESLVKGNERARVGGDRSESVGGSETIDVQGSRSATVGAADSTRVGERHSVTVGQAEGAAIPPTGMSMVDRRISLTTGEATITLEGPNITLEAAAGILMKAGAEIALAAGTHVTAHAAVSMTLKSGATLVVQAAEGDVVIRGGRVPE